VSFLARHIQARAAVFVVAMALAGGAAAAEVRVVATGVFATSLRDLAEPFHAETGDALALTIGNAGVVAARVGAGQGADVVMTSSAGIDALARAEKLDPASKVDIGRMRLGVAVPAGAALPDPSTPDNLAALLRGARTIASIDPAGGATAGAILEKLFVTLGVAEAVHAKAIPCADGAEVAAALASGRASVGMTQASELIGSPGVAFAGFPPDTLNAVTVYSAALPARQAPSEATRAFMAFLRGPVAGARLRQSGWELIRQTH